jgi:hypothetical protein
LGVLRGHAARPAGGFHHPGAVHSHFVAKIGFFVVSKAIALENATLWIKMAKDSGKSRIKWKLVYKK